MASILVVVRGLVVFLVMLTACAVDEPTITPVTDVGLSAIESIDSLENDEMSIDVDAPSDICGLADALPADDLCSLVCDPAALRQAMIDAGVETGRCYLLLCQMSETVHASVGICVQ